MRLDENWIRAHLPPELADAPIDCCSGMYLDGLTVMAEGERGGPDTVVFRAEDEEDLRWWQLEQVCRFLPEKDPPPRKTWRYYRDRAENGQWLYIEHRPYDYNAIEDPRLYGFECLLRNLRYGFPRDRWEEKVREHVRLMNYWFTVPHWDYDREKLCFIEISDSREHSGDGGPEEPRPGSVIQVVQDPEGRRGTERAEDSAAGLPDGGTPSDPRQEDERLTGKECQMEFVVYRDAHYILGQNEDWPYLIADGRRFWLSCHPYEPCLYITDKDGNQTVVHNAFDPRDVLRELRDGRTVTSITGREYDALCFCRMVEYAAGRGTIGMGDAEEVFGEAPIPRPRSGGGAEAPAAPLPDGGASEDPFYALMAGYPDCVIDFRLVRCAPLTARAETHRKALALACRELLAGDGAEGGWRYDVNRARGKRIDAGVLFSPEEPKKGLSYRRAFLHPPHGTAYTGADFDRVNAALFPRGTEELEVYEWTTDWSDYFDDGREWWGTLCLTVYDRAMDRFAVILASATD